MAGARSLLLASESGCRATVLAFDAGCVWLLYTAATLGQPVTCDMVALAGAQHLLELRVAMREHMLAVLRSMLAVSSLVQP